jgi:biopolymer transport protein ExbD
MAIRRAKRSSPSIDMTPMVDLGFLLVTFFMMTTQFAPTDLAPVTIPSAVSEMEMPESNITTIVVSKEGAVYFRMDQVRHMRSLGEKLGDRYQLSLTEEELGIFAKQSGFGLPMGSLKQFLDLPTDDARKSLQQPGIPAEAAQNELSDWIIYSRIANPSSRILFKADKKTPYPAIKKVMDALQSCNIDRFSLITDTEVNMEAATTTSAETTL